MSEEDDGRSDETVIESLVDEFWDLKRRAQRAESAKRSLMFVKEAIGTGLSLTDHGEHARFRGRIRTEMNKLDWDEAEAANWIDKGRGFERWEEVASMKVLDDFHAILADVQSFLVSEGIIEEERETVEDLEEELELLIFREKVEAKRRELVGRGVSVEVETE